MTAFGSPRTLGAWLCLALAACGANTADPGSDSSTHFFSRCETDADCKGAYSCQCNRCTAACTSDEQCGEASCLPVSDVLSCGLEGNVCAPKDAERAPVSSPVIDAGREGPAAPSDEDDEDDDVPLPATPAPTAGGDPSAPGSADAGPLERPIDSGTPEATDADPPIPDVTEPEPGPVTPTDPVEPEPPSPCPGAPECEWVTLPPLPIATRGHAAVESDGVLYVFGGGSEADFGGAATDLYASTWAYDLATAEWSPRAPMPVGAYMLAAHRVGERILVQTGYGAPGFVNALLSYDPLEDAWTELAPMPSYRYIFTTGVVDDRLFVIGGNGTVDDEPQGSQDWEYKDYVQVYDVASDTWSNAAPEPEPTGGAASCTLGSRIYVFGGDVSNRTTVYDASTDTWSEATPPPLPRNAHTCVTVGEVFYLLGGRVSTGGELALVERYDPTADAWSTLPDMPSGSQWFGAAVVDSDVYVVGGQSDTGTLFDAVWLYHTAD